MSTRIEIRLNRLPGMTERLDSAVRDEIARAALALEAQEKASIVDQDAVDTGFMLNSVQAQKEDEHYWIVGNGAEYSAYINYGTVKMPPRNFVESSAAIIEPQFQDNIASAIKAL